MKISEREKLERRRYFLLSCMAVVVAFFIILMVKYYENEKALIHLDRDRLDQVRLK